MTSIVISIDGSYGSTSQLPTGDNGDSVPLLESAVNAAQAFNASVQEAITSIGQALVHEKTMALIAIRDAQWDAITAIRSEVGSSTNEPLLNDADAGYKLSDDSSGPV
jgi:hypothetical protein